jgi:hypothetical protein
MATTILFPENLKTRITQANNFTEARVLLSELFNLSVTQLLPMFGVTRWSPHEVHGIKDRIFVGVATELIRNGWNCDAPSFGEGHRDTLLMEMARRGFAQAAARLLELGADADYNSQGYGASTPLMCTRDPEIMKKLLYYGANPLAINAVGQADFSYKLFKGLTPGARFYLYNTERIPFQSLLFNFRDCILSRTSFPYEPMYPLCLVPVIPEGVPYQNIIDKALIDNMLRGAFLPFSSKALLYPLESNLTVWQYLKFHLGENKFVVPALVVACMACMAKLEECRTPDDFMFLEEYIGKPLPREVVQRENLSKAVFAYLLFSLSILPPTQLLRWLALLGKILRKASEWMDLWGDDPFRVTNSLLTTDSHRSNVLQELTTLQALLAMRVNVSDSFGEFHIPEEFTSLFAMSEMSASLDH